MMAAGEAVEDQIQEAVDARLVNDLVGVGEHQWA